MNSWKEIFDTRLHDDDECWSCTKCQSWATLEDNALAHASKTGHGFPVRSKILKDASSITGFCNVCGQKIPHIGITYLSQYQCSEECRRKCWENNNPDLPVPDWDALEVELGAQFGLQPQLPRWRKRKGLMLVLHKFFNFYD